jgi:hypothetical protein
MITWFFIYKDGKPVNSLRKFYKKCEYCFVDKNNNVYGNISYFIFNLCFKYAISSMIIAPIWKSKSNCLSSIGMFADTFSTS